MTKFFQENLVLSTFGDKLSLNSKLILFAFIFGAFILFMPVQDMLILSIAVFAITFFVIKPKYCYYLVILTLPLTFRLRFLPISFSINDVLILLCVFSAVFNLIFVDKKVSLRTGIDKWIAVLLVLFFAAGATSINPNGILTSFKFLEAIFVFYLTVYFVRTKRLNLSDIFKVLIYTALFQAILGILQSVTGSLGASFQSDRGYLGRLGIGSTMVWHGHGTMGFFNDLGYLLTTITLFYIPVYYFVCKKRPIGNITLSILIWGIITTYSRGSLIGIFAGSLYFLSQIIKNKVRFALILTFFAVFVFIAYLFLSHTSYIETLNPRDRVWEGVIASITSSARYLWFGAGLNSYYDVVPNFLPRDMQWYAHNFYLLTVQEIGIIGFVIFFSFLLSLVIQTWKGFKQNTGLMKALNLSASLSIFAIFFASIFDHSYSLTYFKILLFLLLGLVFARNKG